MSGKETMHPKLALLFFFLFAPALHVHSSEYDEIVGTVQAYVHCDCFKERGTDTVLATIVDDSSVYLVGLKKHAVLWKFAIPVGQINPAKTRIDCCNDGKTIEVVSQAPFSAEENVEKFSFDGKKFTALESGFKDPSLETIAAAVKLALAGDKSALDTFNTQILYPQRYVNSESIGDALAKGHKAALRLYKSKEPAEAAERLKLMFKATYDFCSLISSESAPESAADIEKYCAAWRGAEVEKAAYMAPLNDYGFFLQESGDHKDAVEVFELVIREDSSRAVTYLNGADSYWGMKDLTQAKSMYRKYCEVMKSQKKESGITRRAIDRAK
jgi:hypothetical protein